MTRISWRLVDVMSRMLEPGERDAVRGDITESGESPLQALRDLLGLIVRRQAALWTGWRPWLALIGIAGIAGVLLIQFTMYVGGSYELYFWIIRNYSVMDKTILEQTGLTLRHGIPHMLCSTVLLIAWSWTGGFALASLSRPTILVNGAMFCLVWLLMPHQWRTLFPVTLVTFLFLFPFTVGVYQGLRLGSLGLRPAVFLAAVITTALALTAWTGGWWQARPWGRTQLIFSVALCWPVWYLVASSRSVNKENHT